MINITNKNHWLIEQANNNPSKIALLDNEKTITYLQLLEHSFGAAFHFKSLGVRRNDHVSIVSNNSIEFVITINALWLLGAVPIPLNLKLKTEEIEKLVLHSKSKILLNIDNVIDCSRMQFEKIHSITLKDFTASYLNYSEENFNRNNIALMMYSSGSTGNPKCVRLTFNNLFESTKSLQSLIRHDENNVWLASLPFYHIGGFSIITRSHLWGDEIVFAKSISSDELITSFLKYKPTYFSIVPTMLKKMLAQKIKPWKELKNVFIGGGPLNTEDTIKAIDHGFPLVGVYGSTETSSMVTAVTEKSVFEKMGCAGKPLPGNTIEIIDDKGKTQPEMKIGEVVIFSKCVAKSYFNYSMENGSIISDQKFYSNDLGYLDKEGNLFLIGRKDDIIISGGENINLKEIENNVKLLSSISDCITIKVDDEKWGQSYILIMVLKEKGDGAKAFKELMENVTKFKQPKSAHFVDVIYRNELGKVDKNKHLLELKL